jgi:hypothetical protein
MICLRIFDLLGDDAMRINIIAVAAALVLAAGAGAQAQQISGQYEPDQTGVPSPQATPRSPAPWQTQPVPDALPPQTVPPRKSFDRYNFERIADVLMRLDTVTGQVSVCSEHGTTWVCQPAPEERTALENEIARLQTEVVALKSEVAALREPPPPPRPPADLAPRAAPGDVTIKLPAPEDIERARAAVKYAWQRLVDMLVGIKNDVMKKV